MKDSKLLFEDVFDQVDLDMSACDAMLILCGS